MWFTDLNRASDIGSNSYLLELGPFRIVVDAGINPKKTGWDSTPQFNLLDDTKVDLILLTHCHLDHLGALPVLAKQQPSALILTTAPSKILASRLLSNSVQVMKLQAQQSVIPEYPLYTHADVYALEKRLTALAYGKTRTLRKPGGELKITFYPAGHVVGAAGCVLEYAGKKIFITGDVLFRDQCTLTGAEFPELICEVLIMETTRGATPLNLDQSREIEMDRFITSVANTIDQGGSVLIPAFALGRMQEILSLLYDAMQSKRLVRCPVYCSGLGMALADHFDEISKKTHLLNFSKKMLREMRVQPLKVNLVPGRDLRPGIYVLSSGMLVEHTPSYLVTACLLAHEHNQIAFVGYCDSETPGGALQACRAGDTYRFESLDFDCPVRAKVNRFDLSGHADRDELVGFAKFLNPKTVILTHGDWPARQWFERELTSALPFGRVIDPVPAKQIALVEGT
jgi:Cft2 family RNA processing exonuclease